MENQQQSKKFDTRELPDIMMSFITPCYNDGKYIERFVNSIIDQDFKEWEMIIVNDGSTDDSKIVIDSLVQKDPNRIKAIHLDENKGACIARNLGAKEAKGKYYSFLPADAFLYPGMLRIWIEQLEEYPDYDFLYGGYRIVDENYERVPGGELIFHNFDPYLLETTNYIDGSFPIRATAFWEVSKKLNDAGKQVSDGLWDPAIKSLQDWDFWLSVVKDGRKGIYIQDIFFETVQPHPGGLSFDSSQNWLARVDQIKAKHDIPIRRLCVASIGAGWHAKRMAYVLNADFHEMPSRRQHHYDAIYVVGFYPQFAKQHDSIFLNDYYHDQKGRVASKKIVHFVGTDIWQLRQISLNGLDVWKNYMRNAVDEVLVEADFTQMELKEILGIEAKIVPIPPAKLYDIMPLPEKFSIACYMPGINSNFYNPELMEQVAKELPDVDFKFFGNPMQIGKHKDIKNIEYCGYINDMESFIKECSGIMRFPMHDGLPISVLEFVLAGRYATLNVPVKETYFVPQSDLKSVVESIKLMQEKTKEGPNQKGSDHWREVLNHDKFKESIYKLAGYDPKEYWEARAISWNGQANASAVEEDDVKEFYDEVKPTTLLDLGCGNGRWVPIFKKWGFNLDGYMGVDISGKLIEICQQKFTDMMQSQFYMESAENLNLPNQYDLIFSYTTLEHVKEEDMPKVVENLKKVGKRLLLIEPTGFESRYYCRSHAYEKYFKIVKEKKLADKTIMLIDLQ